MTTLATDGNDLAYPLRLVRGEEAVEQAIYHRLRFFQGSWALDTSAGVPYFTEGLASGRVEDLESLVSAEVASVEGVEEVTQVTVERGQDRELTIGVTARVTGGALVSTSLGVEPF